MRLSFVIEGGKVNFRHIASNFKDIHASDVDVTHFGLDLTLLLRGAIFNQYHINLMLLKSAGVALRDRVMQSVLDSAARGLSCSPCIDCARALEAV